MAIILPTGPTLPTKVLVPPVGWRYSHNQSRPLVQRRQHGPLNKSYRAGPWAGTIPVGDPVFRYQLWDRARLRYLGNYWTQILTGGDRAGWAAFAAANPITTEPYSPRTLTAYRAFQYFNKLQGPAVGDSPAPNSLITIVPQPLAPGSYNPPLGVSITGATLTSAFPGAPSETSIGFIATQNLTAWRAYARILTLRGFRLPRPPLIALATGAATQPHSESFALAGTASTETIVNNQGHTHTYNVAFTFTITGGSGPTGTIIIENPDPTNNPWLTLVALGAWIQDSPYRLRAPGVLTPAALPFSVTIDDSIPGTGGSPNDALVDIFFTSDTSSITAQSITDPDGNTSAPPDQNPPPLGYVLIDVNRTFNTVPTVADFTAQWAALVGPAIPGDAVNMELRLFDPTWGTPSEAAPVDEVFS